MTITQNIRNQIFELNEGEVFDYRDLNLSNKEYLAAAKALERFVISGEIKRFSNGVFYKPKKSLFGELAPSEEQWLMRFLFKDGKRVGYITGNYLYNKLGLTTQIPRVIQIARNDKAIRFSNNIVRIASVKSYVVINNDNPPLLEFLDVLKDFRNISDLNKQNGIEYLLSRINNFRISEIDLLSKYALCYPPRVRAFLGALLQKSNKVRNLTSLKKSLNPFSEFDYGIKKYLSNSSDWQLK